MIANLTKPEKRNIILQGRRTSLQLEAYIWDNLESFLDLTGLSLSHFLDDIDDRRHYVPLAQAVRLFTLIFFKSYADFVLIKSNQAVNEAKNTTLSRDTVIAAESEPLDIMLCYDKALRDFSDAVSA